jgi:hypothetical protein
MTERPQFEKALEAWQSLNQVRPQDLAEARSQAHWAVRIVGAAGEALVPPEPDFGHGSLTWTFETDILAGGLSSDGIRAGLRLADLTLLLLDARAQIRDSLALHGYTFDEAVGWLQGGISSLTSKPLARALKASTEELPDHAVGEGRPFACEDSAAYVELARWYANAARLQEKISANTPGASPVRCWPHHFDIATLITLDRDEPDPEKASSIGFGMTPGDSYYNEPYFYVNPWPYPEPKDLPSLRGEGFWHTEAWVGAVLPASRLKDSSPRQQAEQVHDYVRSAMAAARTLLASDLAPVGGSEGAHR